MILGSMSSAGKSLLVTGLCRLYARRGWRVTPFKAQNMSNNAAVCSGGEIGRAQAVQAQAAGIEPRVEMNPILLKPEADARSQVIIRGQVWKALPAIDYYDQRDILWQAVTGSIDHLKDAYELMIMEGAGSPAEINLQKNDIVNLAAAHYAKAPCLLVGDIDRGGVFAQLLGTLWLLEEADRKLIRGLVVNKFRGDMRLFADGVSLLEEKSGIQVIGVVPYLKDHGIAEEDAATIGDQRSIKAGALDIAVIHLPHISNYDDVDPLIAEPGLNIRFIDRVEQLGSPAVVIIPGTKSTLQDLRWLHENDLGQAIQKQATDGRVIVGLCGGFQILGETVMDEEAIESNLRKLPGLGLLPVMTRFEPTKTITRSQATVLANCGFFRAIRGENISGYEIHMGQSFSSAPISQVIKRENQKTNAADGACSADGKVWGTYLHGIFENDNLRNAWLESLGVSLSRIPFRQRQTAAYDRLADALEKALDIPLLDQIIEEGV
jgi:adenosylcobyric acid synthase